MKGIVEVAIKGASSSDLVALDKALEPLGFDPWMPVDDDGNLDLVRAHMHGFASWAKDQDAKRCAECGHVPGDPWCACGQNCHLAPPQKVDDDAARS